MVFLRRSGVASDSSWRWRERHARVTMKRIDEVKGEGKACQISLN